MRSVDRSTSSQYSLLYSSNAVTMFVKFQRTQSATQSCLDIRRVSSWMESAPGGCQDCETIARAGVYHVDRSLRSGRVYPEGRIHVISLTRHDLKSAMPKRDKSHDSCTLDMVKPFLEFVIRHVLASSAASGWQWRAIEMVE